VIRASVLAIVPVVFAAFAAGQQAATTDTAALARIASSGSPSFSPDGSRVAFLSDVSGSRQVWVAPVDGGWPAKLTSLPEAVRQVSWSPAGDLLAFTAASGAGRSSQIYLVAPDGTGLRRITSGGREANQWGAWSGNRKLLAFSSDRRAAASMDGYQYDVASGETKLVIRADGTDRFTDLPGDGSIAAVVQTDDEGNTEALIVNLRDGKQTPGFAARAPSVVRDAVLANGGTSLYLVTNEGRDRFGLAVLRLEKDEAPGPLEWLREREDADIEELAVSPSGDTAALLWNLDGRSELELLDLETGDGESAPRLPQPVASDLDFSSDGSLLAMTLSGSSAPPEVWILEEATGAFRRLTQTPDSGVDVAGFVAPELVEFRSHDGVEISGWLYLSRAGNQSGPVVLSFHDGPEGQARPGFHRDYQALLERGISVFAPNVRGSSGFGKNFTELDNGPLRADAIRDIRASVDYLVQSGIAEPRRIGIMGEGYGGYLAMAGLTEYPELFAAGVTVGGFYDLVGAPQNLRPWETARWIREFGDPDTQLDMLRALSPAGSLDRVKAPVLFVDGTHDVLTPPATVEGIVEDLRNRGQTAELLSLPGEGRRIEKTADRVRMLDELVRWFDRLRQ